MENESSGEQDGVRIMKDNLKVLRIEFDGREEVYSQLNTELQPRPNAKGCWRRAVAY